MPSTIPKRAIAIRLAVSRRGKGLSQAEVGRRVGCCQGTISRVELGRQRPSLELFYRLVALYGINADWAMFGSSRRGGSRARNPEVLPGQLSLTG